MAPLARTGRLRCAGQCHTPNDPAVSTLSFGIHRSIQFMFVFAITWLAFVVGFTVIWWVASQSDDVLVRNIVVR